MIARFFSWLETRVDSFPPEQAGMPPPSFWGFIAYYTRPFCADDHRIVGAVGGHRADRGVAVRLPRQSRRLAVEGGPRHLLVDARPVPHRHGRHRAGRPAGAEILLRGRGAPGAARQLRHAHALAGAPLRAAPVHGLLQRRLRRPRRHQGDADRDGGARGGHEDRRGAALRLHLLHRRRHPVRGDRPAAVGAAAAVAGRLPRRHALFHSAPGPYLARPVGRPLDHDGPHRRHATRTSRP